MCLVLPILRSEIGLPLAATPKLAKVAIVVSGATDVAIGPNRVTWRNTQVDDHQLAIRIKHRRAARVAERPVIAVGDQLSEGLCGPIVGKAAGVPILGATCFGEQGVAAGVNVQRNLSMGIALFG